MPFNDLEFCCIQATSMDEVLHLQQEFTDLCLKDCMLQATNLLQILRRILDVSLTFASYIDVSNPAVL